MSGQRAGASDHDAGWWHDDAPYQDGYRHDAPRRDDAYTAPPRRPAAPRPRRSDEQDRPQVPRQGGRAEARRAQQGGRGGDDGSGGGGGGGRADARRARKRPKGRKKVVVWVAVATLGLVTAAGGALYLKFSGNIKAFDGDGLSKNRPDAATPDANGHTPINVLLIGSDSRSGDNKDLGGGEDGGARSDTTILLHVYADHKHAVGVSFPRDALVDIPPCKLPDGSWTKKKTDVMFNSAFSTGNSEEGNPACTQNTVEALTNIRIDHTMVVNFEGFSAMTSAVGGVNVCLPNAIYEGDLNPNLGKKGKQIYPKGEQKVEGKAALDYVRLRHGIGDGSDVGRMKRQQAFMASLIKSVKTKGMDPTTLLPLADAATKSMIVDPGLNSPAKLISFAMQMKDIDLHNIKFLTTPWKFSGARIDLVHPDVDTLWQALKADRTLDGQDASADAGASASAAPAPTPTPATVDGAGIKVGVYNGTLTSGLTTKAAATLTGSGFTVAGRGNATAQNHEKTLVQYGPGQKDEAEQVAKLFPGATLQSSTKAGVSLVLGADYAAGSGGAASAVPSTLPSSVAKEARSADDDPCSNVSYG
ncbi:LCP family protein [Kitasatospora sp. DSM 101779]|uniref:LCP family protein n=1 Tax=Kitasatospora sp. DSM 101779 TaxID=2853165 RepID=UPI0021DACB83|nr:LCP family protein [Kitasatospora sp. DSM 101779]MCU7823548.1 LCP family protein [Kitasatospora sp. DSM 101779]